MTEWVLVRCTGCERRFIRSTKNTTPTVCCQRDAVMVRPAREEDFPGAMAITRAARDAYAEERAKGKP